jgi:hypothetical protein
LKKHVSKFGNYLVKDEYTKYEVNDLIKITREIDAEIHARELLVSYYLSSSIGFPIILIFIANDVPGGLIIGPLITTFLMYTLNHTSKQLVKFFWKGKKGNKKDDGTNNNNDSSSRNS